MKYAPALLLLIACTGTELGTESTHESRIAPVCEPIGGEVAGVSFTDEQATSVVDMADNATRAELQQIHGIGPSIADKIVAGRPYRAAPDPLAALDAVSYVGPQVLGSLRDQAFSVWCSLDDGRQFCCIELECTGASDGAPIAVTDSEAYAILDWANRATTDELVEVCSVGPEIAAEIIAARPVRSLAALEDVKYVGEARLRHIAGLDDYLCSQQGSALEHWCAAPDAQCFCDDGSFVLDEGAAIELAEEAASVFYADNADFVWEEYCEVSYEHSLGIDQVVVQEFCDPFVLERFIPAARAAGAEMAGAYPSEQAALEAVSAMVEDLFFDRIWDWMASFEDELLAWTAG